MPIMDNLTLPQVNWKWWAVQLVVVILWSLWGGRMIERIIDDQSAALAIAVLAVLYACVRGISGTLDYLEDWL